MQQMESVYVQKMGQTKYYNMIVSLINHQLPSMKSSIDFSVTTTSSANPDSPVDRGVSTLESPF
jgi:hypothetical protein